MLRARASLGGGRSWSAVLVCCPVRSFLVSMLVPAGSARFASRAASAVQAHMHQLVLPSCAGTCPPDQTTFVYVRERTSEPFEPVYADDAASYVQEYRFDVSKLQPLVAAPHSPDNRKDAAACRDVKIDRVYIGCARRHWPGRARRLACLAGELHVYLFDGGNDGGLAGHLVRAFSEGRWTSAAHWPHHRAR